MANCEVLVLSPFLLWEEIIQGECDFDYRVEVSF